MRLHNVAIVGASGLVGRTMLKVLEERNFPIASLRLFGSDRSGGTELEFRGEKFKIEVLDEKSFTGIDIALFSAGSSVSIKYAPICADSGCVAIDNSSAWRRDEYIPLVVPEVNPDHAFKHKGIIANPNCNVIPLVVAFKPINDNFGLKRAVVSTYQSISGAGRTGIDKLSSEIQGISNNDKHQIFSNAIFHPIQPGSDYTNEEIKLQFESQKIMDIPDLKIAATCVRLPFFACHAESANLELKNPYNLAEVREILNRFDGIVVQDNLAEDEYPTPQSVAGKDEVYVGRIRRDESVENGLAMWIVSDNIRKGAATNAVQIAELLISR